MATESLEQRLCGVWRVVRKHRNIIMRGFRIRTCSQGGWPPGRAPGQLPPSMPPASPNRPRSPPLPGSHPLDDGIALEQSPVEPAHPDAVHAPPAAVVAAVVRGCGLTTARCSIRWSWSPCRTAWPYFPLGSSRPRCRSRTPPPSIRVCGREVESGRVMACPGCGQVKLPKPPTEASAW